MIIKKNISDMEHIVLDFFTNMYKGYLDERYENETFKEYITQTYSYVSPMLKDRSMKYFREFRKYYKKYLKEFICPKGNLTPYRIWFFNTKEKILNNKIQLVDINKPRIYY